MLRAAGRLAVTVLAALARIAGRAHLHPGRTFRSGYLAAPWAARTQRERRRDARRGGRA